MTQILDSSLTPGSQLPTEQAQANQLGVSRSTLRRALERLRQDRLIVSRQGGGNYVAGLRSNVPLTYTIEPDCEFEQILEIRRNLDSLAAAHAATAQDSSLIGALENTQSVMRRAIDSQSFDAINIRRADIEFHSLIAESSPNPILKQLIGTLSSAVGPYWLIWMKLSDDRAKRIANASWYEHDLILAAIKAGAPDFAEAAMRRHFTTSQERSRGILD